MAKKLPDPDCIWGYSGITLEKYFGERMTDFLRFMRGQTFSVCDGRRYDRAAKEYVPTDCGPHGAVYYTSDVHMFIVGGPPLD